MLWLRPTNPWRIHGAIYMVLHGSHQQKPPIFMLASTKTSTVWIRHGNIYVQYPWCLGSDVCISMYICISMGYIYVYGYICISSHLVYIMDITWYNHSLCMFVLWLRPTNSTNRSCLPTSWPTSTSAAWPRTRASSSRPPSSLTRTWGCPWASAPRGTSAPSNVAWNG